jgi:hypothetical protein
MKDLAQESTFILTVLQTRNLSADEVCAVLTLAKACLQDRKTAPAVLHALEAQLNEGHPHHGDSGSLVPM